MPGTNSPLRKKTIKRTTSTTLSTKEFELKRITFPKQFFERSIDENGLPVSFKEAKLNQSVDASLGTTETEKKEIFILVKIEIRLQVIEKNNDNLVVESKVMALGHYLAPEKTTAKRLSEELAKNSPDILNKLSPPVYAAAAMELHRLFLAAHLPPTKLSLQAPIYEEKDIYESQ